MNELSVAAIRGRSRGALALDRVERLYLTLLRGAVLVVATIILIWAAWLAVSSIYRITRSTDSVTERPVSVGAAELEPAKAAGAADVAKDGPVVATPAEQKFFQDFVGRYYRLYRTKFEAFRRSEDKRLTRDEFDDNFVQSTKRMESVAGSPATFNRERNDLEALLVTMQTAADLPAIRSKLKEYQQAQRRTVEREVRRTRTETRRGWDSYSTDCSNWYESPMGCAVNRQVSVPYTQKVRTTALPEGIASHTQTFRSMQDRYFSLLEERRSQAASDVNSERDAISIGNAEGWAGLSTLLWALGGFLILMFFFVLIAIERHQRTRVTDRQQATMS